LLPESLLIIKIAERLRQEGYAVWETMDAGPQVKLVYRSQDEAALLKRFNMLLETYNKQFADTVKLLYAKPGADPEIKFLDAVQEQSFLDKL